MANTQPPTFVSSLETSSQSIGQSTSVHVQHTMSARSTTLDVTSKPTDHEKKTTTLPTESETTIALTTEPQEPGCVLPVDFDPDIMLSLTKDSYDAGDFIILSCPPPPYTAVGEVFSQCSAFGWLPDISGNACYAPCSAPSSLPSYLTHHEQSTGDTLAEYTHGAVLTFECTDTSKVLNHISSPMCVDGVWKNLDYPTCEDPLCTLPADLDDDIIVNPQKDEYIEDDFILLYCPPVPYATRGTPFSVCENGKWDPAISDNACYAPCDPPDLLGPVTYTQSNGLFYLEQYTHDSVLEFTCTSGLLDGPTGVACVDGSWNPDAVPSCIYDGISQWPTASTEKSQPIFTQEYFTLPPDGHNCTTYPTILDDDIYVIPQQSRVDNQFIHGDSFLLYCNDTISTPMIWFTFCWDSRWYPDPAKRFCYRYCEIPDVSSDVYHYLASTGISSKNFYRHSSKIRFNCSSSQRPVLQGTDTMVCFDGKWSPEQVPTCIGASTLSIPTTPLSSAYTSTDDWTSSTGSLTTDPHLLRTSDIAISHSTFSHSDNISTRSMLTSTTSATDADGFTAAFTFSPSTAEKRTAETTESKTVQTEHITTKITKPLSEHTTDITIDGETDQFIMPSKTEDTSPTQDVTLESTAGFVTDPQLNSESSIRTLFPATSRNITKTHTFDTSTVDRQTVAATQHTSNKLLTATTERHNTAIPTDEPTSYISLPHRSTAKDESTSSVPGMSLPTLKTTARQTEAGTTTLVTKDRSGVSSQVITAPLLTTKTSSSASTYSALTSKAAESTVPTSWLTAPPLEITTHIALTDANEMSTLSMTGMSSTSRYDTSSNSYYSEISTDEATSKRLHQTMVTSDAVNTNKAKSSLASADLTFEAFTTIEFTSTKRKLPTRDMATAEVERTTRISEDVTTPTVKEAEHSSAAERTTPSQQVTSQQPEIASDSPLNWWVIFIAAMGAASLFCLLATCTGFIFAALFRRKRNKEDRKHRRIDPSDSSVSGSVESTVTYNPRATTVSDPEDPRSSRY